jgi:hypothetical protein
MTKREALARFLTSASRAVQEQQQAYEQLSCGIHVRREQPKDNPNFYPTMPAWEWSKGDEARKILEFLKIDPEEDVDAINPEIANLQRQVDLKDALLRDATANSDQTVVRLGYKPRQLQLKWRTNPPRLPPAPPAFVDGRDFGEYIENPARVAAQEARHVWTHEAYAAVVDALVHEGVTAWPGDATGCVVQMLVAFAEREQALIKEGDPDRKLFNAS